MSGTSNQRKSFFGTGWGFPVAFSKQRGCTVRLSSDIEDIRESLQILLSTRPGERVLRPDYGCNLSDLLFDPMNTNLTTYVKEMLSKAILYYEPRINLNDIRIDLSQQLEGILLIELFFEVRATNSRFNFVYDYYKKEITVTTAL